jgi:serine/threonine protein kinase
LVEGTPFGRYRLIELLGRGGMGEVWRAHDPDIDRVVAMKVLPAQFNDDPTFQERFRREARAAAGLDEPHVVPIHEVGEVDGRMYVTMRLIKGRDLQSLIADGPLPPARAIGIVEQIASALHAAHEIGLVHRDVKPSNILVAADDFAYLIDFGIARAVDETGLTNTGSVIGTWAYMAPERLNTGSSDARADIYALTCVLHEALTGERPFPGNSLEQQVVGHLTSPPPRPSSLRWEVPVPLDDVIATGMAKDPDARYATAREMSKAARASLAAPNPTRASPPAPPTVQAARPILPSEKQDLTARRPVQPARRTAKDFWSHVGIDPIRIVTSTGDFLTLRCYLDDEPIFLGDAGRINVFRSGRALCRYLANDTANDMSSLDTFDAVRAAATDGSLPVDKVTADNTYVLKGLDLDIAEEPASIDRDQLELAIELLTDVGDYVRDSIVDDVLRAGQPLGDLVEFTLAVKPITKRWPSGADAAFQWQQLTDFLDAQLYVDRRYA